MKEERHKQAESAEFAVHLIKNDHKKHIRLACSAE